MFGRITDEEKLMTAQRFNKDVRMWTLGVRGEQINILHRTHGSGFLENQLRPRWLSDRRGGPAYVGLGFRFPKYGAYREYGAGRGYIVKDGVIMKGHSMWADPKYKNKRRSTIERRLRGMRVVDDHYAVIRRTALPWLDPPITRNINELADISGEYYGDRALKQVLRKFNILTIEKRYGKGR